MFSLDERARAVEKAPQAAAWGPPRAPRSGPSAPRPEDHMSADPSLSAAGSDGVQPTLSPVTGAVILERPLAGASALDATLDRAERGRRAWRETPLERRLELISAMVDDFASRKDSIAAGLVQQIGRPTKWAGGEVNGFVDRARTMIRLAPGALAPINPGEKPGFLRSIKREPLGTVLVLAPWNYPYLTAVNAVVPALAAGNAVVLKHSDQSPLCAEEMVASARAAGIPEEVFQFIHMSHERTAAAVGDPRIHHVCFTGSVEGGHAVLAAARRRFIDVGLELGGKDPAYVRPDADLAFAAENIVEGVLFNSGQSCCAVERIYVHEAVYDDFIERAIAECERWVVGDPADPATWMGPMARARGAETVRRQVDAAMAAGAWGLVDPAHFGGQGANFVAPQLLAEVTHEMELMREETFGPVAGVMRVRDDAEAVRLMNDSRYGLTASLWSRDLAAAEALGDQLETGTVFLNRCDYLDPELAWTGVKDSGRGATLSVLGFHHLTRAKSFHLRRP